LTSTGYLPQFHLGEQRSDLFLGDRVDSDEGDPRTWDTVYNGGPGGERFDERQRRQVLFALDLEESPTGADQVDHRLAQLAREHAGWVPNAQGPSVAEGPEHGRVDRVVPLRLKVDDADQGEMAQLDRPGRDPVAAGGEEPQPADRIVGADAVVDRPIPLRERRAKPFGDDPDAPVT
jgi:hypothetical protein